MRFYITVGGRSNHLLQACNFESMESSCSGIWSSLWVFKHTFYEVKDFFHILTMSSCQTDTRRVYVLVKFPTEVTKDNKRLFFKWKGWYNCHLNLALAEGRVLRSKINALLHISLVQIRYRNIRSKKKNGWHTGIVAAKSWITVAP